MTYEEAIELLTAVKTGKTVQYSISDGPWEDAEFAGRRTKTVLSELAVDNAKFRIKPEPKSVWLVVCNDPSRGELARVLLDKDAAEALAATRLGATVTEYREVIE